MRQKSSLTHRGVMIKSSPGSSINTVRLQISNISAVQPVGLKAFRINLNIAQ